MAPKSRVCLAWEPHPDNKKQCAYYRKGGLCLLPGRVRCIGWLIRNQEETSIEELLSHPDFGRIDRDLKVENRRGKPVRVSAGDAPRFLEQLYDSMPWFYSFSQLLGCYGRCRYKWFLRYLKRIKPITTPHYLLVGKAGHKVLEGILTGKSWKDAARKMEPFFEAECDDANYLNRLYAVRGLCRAYYRRNKGRHIEVEARLKHPLLPLVGYVDAREQWQNKVLVHEHKFAAAIGEFSASWRAQALFYWMLDSDIENVSFNLFKKPCIRSWKPKKGEPINAFRDRVFSHVHDHWDEFFRQVIVHRKGTAAGNSELTRFHDEVVHLVSELELARQQGFRPSLFPRNFYHCKMFGMSCEYADFCATGQLDPTRYYVEHGVSGREKEEGVKT